MSTSSPPSGARAVDRAADLLVTVIAAGAPVSFTGLVSASGLPKSTVSRLLSSLERNGLIARTASADVVPGAVLTAYARTHSPEDDLLSCARPALERLGTLTGETINLAVPAHDGVMQIDQVDPRFMLGAVNWLGREVPYHCSALGKVLLAHGATLPAGRLVRLTDRTLTSRSALADDLRLTRERGYAVADGELEPGLIAIAAPIMGDDDHAVAAISVSGPAVRITPSVARRIGAQIVAEAHEVSTLLTRSRSGLASPGRAGAA